MTVRIVTGIPNRETRSAEQFRDALIASEPRLNHPDITADILCSLPLPGREIDIVLLYHDARKKNLLLKTPGGAPIHSFVLIVEVKRHSPDLIRFEGPRVLVRYDQRWHDATEQCDQQTWALKNYQTSTYKGSKRRQPTYVQRAIWLSRAASSAFDGDPAKSSVPIHFADLSWGKLVNGMTTNGPQVRTFVDQPVDPKYHSIETLRALLTHQVHSTTLDLRRIDALTHTRFDADKTAYIQNLGNGLLILRGRGGTGKTFALIQIALHLARLGKRTVFLTYNHGLIADINRALRFIARNDPGLDPLPRIQTRYAFIQGVFIGAFGKAAETQVRNAPSIDARETTRLQALMHHKEPIETEFDFVLVDEGQDWTERQRDLMFHLFGPGHVIVADGVDQFVGNDRCNWDRGDIPINRRHSLRASRRTKGATCQTIGDIAQELGLSDWDLEPDPNVHGGRFTVLVEPDPRRAVEQVFEMLEKDQRQTTALKAIDNLVCLPSAKMAGGTNYAALFDQVADTTSRDSWRGFDSKDRRIYPVRDGQLRAISYHSCRGMEGWTTFCLGLDDFFGFQLKRPQIDISGLEETMRENEGLLFSKELMEAKLAHQARMFAINWLMIPLTRSIDHLVVHLKDEQSELGKILGRVSAQHPGAIEWIGAKSEHQPSKGKMQIFPALKRLKALRKNRRDTRP